jgi:capsid protein
MFSAMAHATPIHKTAQTGKTAATLSHTGQLNTLFCKQLRSLDEKARGISAGNCWARFFIRKRESGLIEI